MTTSPSPSTRHISGKNQVSLVDPQYLPGDKVRPGWCVGWEPWPQSPHCLNPPPPSECAQSLRTDPGLAAGRDERECEAGLPLVAPEAPGPEEDEGAEGFELGLRSCSVSPLKCTSGTPA